MNTNDKEKTAATKRKLIEDTLTPEFQGQLVQISDGLCSSYGVIRSIGVEWTGNDEYEVIINLEGTRRVLPYQEFLTIVTTLQ